jgi:hypothetical protein
MKPPVAFDRAGAKAAGYTDAEIDAYLAQGTPVSTKSPASPKEAVASKKEAEGWSTRGKALSVAREALGQGAAFGFGDELEAGITSLLPGRKSYGEELQRIRSEMGQFGEAYPKTALAAQVAGGVASGAGLAKGAVAGVKGASAIARALTKSAALQGAVGGAGASDEGVVNRLVGAGAGGAIGGALGRAGGLVAERGARALTRGGISESAGVAAMREAMEAQKLTPDALRARAAQMAASAPEARAMDVLGEPGVRIGRRLQAIGGEAGQDISSAMAARAETKPERLQQALTRTTGKGKENLLETVSEIAKRRKDVADPLYEEVKQQPPVVSDQLEKFISSRKSLRDADKKARELMEEAGVDLPTMATAGGTTPLRTPEYLDYMKRAIDDQLYNGKRPGPGQLGYTEQRLIRDTRKEFVDMLDMTIPGYKEARDAWAGETALLNALETGQEFAAKKITANDLAEVLGTMSDSEREFVQRGWLDVQRERISDNLLRPSELKTPKYREKVQALFGEQSDDILNALDTEMQLGANASAIMGGSRTAPLQADIAQELAPTRLGKAVRAIASPRATAVNLLEAGVTRAGERIGGDRAAARRVQKAAAMLTPAGSMGDILQRVEREYGARARGEQVGRRVGTAIGGIAGRESVRRARGEL